MAEFATDNAPVLVKQPALKSAIPTHSHAGFFASSLCLLNSLALSFTTVFLMEWIARGTLDDVGTYLFSPDRPGLAAIGLFFVFYIALDALLGRAHQAALILMPLAILPAFISSQKQMFLSDPLYPSDMLFGRQIFELMPAMVADRPLAAFGYGVATVLAVASIVYLWIFARRNFNPISTKGKLARLAVAIPLIAGFVPLLDYAKYSPLRDQLNIIPMMWDQKANYRQNGFLFAFAFNIPMANVAPPQGYDATAIDQIPSTPASPVAVAARSEKPDVIMIMSESLWDPTRITSVRLTPDPMPVIRANQSGTMFSPEFGGMTANVEFEALTGFSNAFLPTGSIPYQQYIRRPLPSLATFFKSQGYAAKAFHPFQSWFWNRGNVYDALGFDNFLSEENMPPMEKRGIFASDEALTAELIKNADSTDKPFFFFAVTLQGHGPYEAGRYKNNTIAINGPDLSDGSKAILATYSQGVREADDSLKHLMQWAKKRDRETIIMIFGDHLPPLRTVYPESGYMKDQVADRRADVEQMAREHETPLVIWSSKTGTKKDLGAVSPSQLPMHLLTLAGFEHPFYTGLLGRVHERYDVVDRYMLVDKKGEGHPDWLMAPVADPALNDYRLVQYDTIFGEGFSTGKFFPKGQLLPAS